MNCPKCRQEIHIFCNDGGSGYCGDCQLTFHYCLNGVKYSSPGPVMCPFCKELDATMREVNNIIHYHQNR